MTYLLVLPYHNPFLAAKALSTVDRLSGGRLTVVAGTGYLRSEFLALNVDMEQRNELFDESLEVLRGVWTQVPFAHEGKHFTARGVASLPGPVQPGGPPVLIGGNSARARARAARNQGWSPLLVAPEVARTSRTPGIATVAELAARIREVRDAADQRNGSGAPLTIQAHTPQSAFMRSRGRPRSTGTTSASSPRREWTRSSLRPPGDDLGRAVDALHQYAETFLQG